MQETSERYTSSGQKDEIYYEHIQRYYFAKGFIDNKKVLDVACGSGYGTYFMARNGAQLVTGIDISEEVINYCQKCYRNKNLAFEVMDATDLKFPDNSFDVIVSFETIEHLSDHDLFLTELKRVLKPQGVVIISTPNKAVYGKLEGDAHKFHLKEFYLDEFKDLVSRYFNIQRLYGQKRSKYCDMRIDDYNKKIKKYSDELCFLRNGQPRFRNQIFKNICCYLSKKISEYYFRQAFSIKDLVISESSIDESKFFLSIGNK